MMYASVDEHHRILKIWHIPDPQSRLQVEPSEHLPVWSSDADDKDCQPRCLDLSSQLVGPRNYFVPLAVALELEVQIHASQY